MGLNPSNTNVNSSNCFETIGDGPYLKDTIEIVKNELITCIGVDVVCEITPSTKQYYMPRPGSKTEALKRMGITIHGQQRNDDLEPVDTFEFVGRFNNWEFTRAWYYWRASTEKASFRIPLHQALLLNEKYERTVRADGFAGGRVPQQDVSNYHIDTFDGLIELGKVIRNVR